MPSAVESLLNAWAAWSRHDCAAGPRAVGCQSAEHAYRSPQCWDQRAPRLVVIPDDEAMRIEQAVLRCGPILAASLRAYFIFGRGPRRRAEVEMLRHAIARVGDLLAASPDAQDRPVARSARADGAEIADAPPARL